MTAVTPASAPARTSWSTPVRNRLAVGRLAFRQIRTGAVVLGTVSGGSVWATATAYAHAYPTAADRARAAAAVGATTGFRILLGPVQDMSTVGGYVVYKNFVFLTLTGALWGLLAGTRLLRGEEDLGRRQLVLAGATSRSGVNAAAVGALGAAVGVVLVLDLALTLLAARDPALGLSAGGAALYAAGLAAVPAVFVSVGALASQLARSRRVATTLSLAVVAGAFALRMAADARDGLHWLLWTTPFGWTELTRPFSAPDARPIGAAAATALALAAGAVVLAGRRDVGSGVVSFRDTRAARHAGLGSWFGLLLRQEAPVLLTWGAGALASGALFGLFAHMAGEGLPDSLRDSLDRYGAGAGAVTDQFLGLVFLIVATLVALLPASQITAAATEETSGRLVHVLAGPVRRSAWLAGRLVLAAGAVTVAGVLGGVGVWGGARLQGLTLSLPTLLGAGLNVVPTALVALGAGALVLAVRPRAAGAAVYAVVVWSIFADLLGPLVGGGVWLTRSSLFHWMATVPAQDARPGTVAATLGVFLLLASSATTLFARRDLRPA